MIESSGVALIGPGRRRIQLEEGTRGGTEWWMFTGVLVGLESAMVSRTERVRRQKGSVGLIGGVVEETACSYHAACEYL